MFTSKYLIRKNWIGSRIDLQVCLADRQTQNILCSMNRRKGTGLSKSIPLKLSVEYLDRMKFDVTRTV